MGDAVAAHRQAMSQRLTNSRPKDAAPSLYAGSSLTVTRLPIPSVLVLCRWSKSQSQHSVAGPDWVSCSTLCSVLAEWIAGVTALGTLVTAGGVFFAAKQVEASKDQAKTSFEDDLEREYRQLIGELPASAFWEDGSGELNDENRRAFYRYFDLCNAQLFMAAQNRIRTATVSQWRDGIRGNLALPAFRLAWADIAERLPDDYLQDLRTEVPPADRRSLGTIESRPPD